MSERMPLFSVIIPARNMERFLGATLDSLAAQTFDDFEVICVNDGSQDRTGAILQHRAAVDPRFRSIDGPKTGVSAARNAGLAQARGRYLLFLDADDLVTPDALSRYLHILETQDVVGVIGGVLKISEDGQSLPSSDNRDLVPQTDQLAALLRKNYIVNGGALALRASHARAVGGYDTDLRNGEDWEFWCRLALGGRFGVLLGAPVLMYRQVTSGANMTTRGSALGFKVASLSKIARNADFRERFGFRLPLLLRARRIDYFWSGVRNQYRHGSRATALMLAAVGVILYPDTVLRPHLFGRFLRGLGGARRRSKRPDDPVAP